MQSAGKTKFVVGPNGAQRVSTSRSGPKRTAAKRTSKSKKKTGRVPLVKNDFIEHLCSQKMFLRLFEFFCYGLLGVAGLMILSLSSAPWFDAAGLLSSADSPLPFIAPLAKLPIVGGWFAQALQNRNTFIGGVLFLLCNVVQLSAFIINATDGFLDTTRGRRLAALSMVGYGLELCVAVMAHPPYMGGMAAFASDAPMIDPYFIQYGQILAIALLLFTFEVVLWMGVALIGSLRAARKSRKTRTA